MPAPRSSARSPRRWASPPNGSTGCSNGSRAGRSAPAAEGAALAAAVRAAVAAVAVADLVALAAAVKAAALGAAAVAVVSVGRPAAEDRERGQLLRIRERRRDQADCSPGRRAED